MADLTPEQNPSPAVLVDGNGNPVAVDGQGRIVVSPPSAAAIRSGFAAGYVATAATTRVPVRSSAYTEQSANGQRSIVSTSANDTAAGTGVRTVRITYLPFDMSLFKTETLSLNGTTPVSTVATDICYIEKLEALTVGSGLVAAGTINLKAAVAGGGATIWSIPAGDNQAFGAHHYVPAGQVGRVTGISAGHNGTVVGSGAMFTINAKPMSVANSVEAQISDFVRLYGQSSTISRNYGTPLEVAGPARLTLYLTPESTAALVYRASFDFYDQGE